MDVVIQTLLAYTWKQAFVFGQCEPTALNQVASSENRGGYHHIEPGCETEYQGHRISNHLPQKTKQTFPLIEKAACG
jgi:hypothetical protein